MPLSFEPWGFSPAYDVVPEPEFPGNGRWRCPLFNFDRSGELVSEPRTRWGAHLPVEFQPVDSPAWVGTFAAGGLGGVTGIYACPSSFHAAVAVDGVAYLVDVNNPGSGATIAHDQVSQVVPVESDLLLFVRMIDVVAIGHGGIQWKSARLAVDGLHVERASLKEVVCTSDLLGSERAVISLDPRTGVQIGGPRLDSFWPPEAL